MVKVRNEVKENIDIQQATDSISRVAFEKLLIEQDHWRIIGKTLHLQGRPQIEYSNKRMTSITTHK